SAAIAQHAGHSGAPPEAEGGTCAEHARQSLQIIDRINRRLEEARQSNNPARMRAAMDDLQAALGELKTHQSLSIGATASKEAPPEWTTPGSGQGAPAMDHSKMGHEMGAPAKGAAPPPKTATPHDSTKAPAPQGKLVDPVCGMSVEPKPELQVSYGGKTYYFCSTEDKEKFLREPGKYVKQ
ncbi:MAG: YHS domain-containing protein, partial [Thermoanaerobaculia bacterium]